MFKLVINTLPSDFILFINNYFIELKLTERLKNKEITIYRIMKSNRPDLPELLVEMKKLFLKDIPYGVLAVVI